MKIFLWLVLSFFLSASNVFANPIGKNELTLSSNAASYFVKYIKKKGQNSPSLFLTTESGRYSYWFWCSHGMGQCTSNPGATEKCERTLKEIPDNVKQGLKIIPVKHVEEVLKIALTKSLKPVEWVEIEQIPSNNNKGTSQESSKH